MPRLIVLVGLPGAGKSTVGALAAARCGWSFVDLDVEIERAAGMTVAEIFARDGEAGFRLREREATQRLADADRVVVAAGGGWMLDPANRTVLGGRAVTVYIRVSPEVAIARMRAEVASRPLLAGTDPLGALERLYATRDTLYVQANHILAAETMSADEVADTIVALATSPEAD